MGTELKHGYVPLPDASPEDREAAGVPRIGRRRSDRGTPGGREWKNEWYQCCGDCDGTGWAVCCLTHWCFPCVFGYLKRRAFGDSGKAFAWGFTLCLCVFYLFAGACLLYDRALHADARERSPPSGDFRPDFGPQDLQPGLGAHELPETPAAKASALSIYVCMSLVLVMVLTIMVVGGARNRLEMRKKFGIRPAECCGPDHEHVLLWVFCSECALCQETRTVIHNNVVHGVWRGPDSMSAAPDGTNQSPGEHRSRGSRGAQPPMQHMTRPVDVV